LDLVILTSYLRLIWPPVDSSSYSTVSFVVLFLGVYVHSTSTR